MELIIIIGIIILVLGLVKKLAKLIGLGILVAVVAFALNYLGILNLGIFG